MVKNRLSKDLLSYQKEQEEEQNKIEEMKQKNQDEYDIRQLVFLLIVFNE